MQYRALFSLTIRHDYYDSGECPDFTVAPTPECARLLQNYRLLGRPGTEGYRVLASLNRNDATKPFFDLPQGLRFSFFLYLNNPKFINFTDLDASYGQNLWGKPVVFFNNALPSQTDAFDFEQVNTAGGIKKFILSGTPPPSTTIGTGETNIRITKTLKKDSLEIVLKNFDSATNTIDIEVKSIETGVFEVSYPLMPNTLKAGELLQLHTEKFDMEAGGLKDGKRLFSLGKNAKPGTTTDKITLESSTAALTSFSADKNSIGVDPQGVDTGLFSVTYPVVAALPAGCFARADIQILDPVAFSNLATDNPGNAFHIDFRAKSFYWKACAVAPEVYDSTKKTFGFDSAGNSVMYRQHGTLIASGMMDIFDNIDDKITTSKGEKKAGLEAFKNELARMESQGTLGDYQTRRFIFSNFKIPCREKYTALPKFKVDNAGTQNDYTFSLPAPPDGMDVIRILPI